MEGTERRTHQRLPREAVVTCQEVTYPLGAAPQVAVQLVDLSEGGAKLRCDSTWDEGTLLRLTVVLEGWQRHTASFSRYDESGSTRPLTALGRVTRALPLGDGTHEVGVQFVDIWKDDWEAVRLFLERELGSRTFERKEF